MADVERSALGLSVGATNLAAVTAERSVTRKPVLTLYRQRPPEVGLPAENPMLNEPGLVISDFVDRVGDPAGIVAADASMHRSETLIADALRALAYTATDGRALPDAVAATHPAHWAPGAVDAVRVALGRVSEWAGGRLVLLPDSAAALIALTANPGLPSRGIVAVCDFGGTGTSLTLVDAANGFQAVGAAVRHAEFSGDLIDQAILTHIVSDLSSAGSFDTSATSAIGSLTRLRTACRRAKEELSSTTVTTLTADVPGYRGDIRLTRAELDDAIRQSLDGFIAAVQETLQRNGIRTGDLAAIASVGGGASIPTITTTLSEHLRVPVITTPRPHLTAAIGAALRAVRGPADDGQTALAPTAAGSASDPTTVSDIATPSPRTPALAWSEATDDSGIMPVRTGEYPEQTSDSPLTSARPPATVDDHDQPGGVGDAWYRRPPVVMVGTALVVLALGAAIMLMLRHTSGSTPSTPTPSVSTTPAPAHHSRTRTEVPSSSSPPSSTESDTGTPSSTTTQPTTTTPEPTTTTTTTQAPTTTTQTPEPPFRRFPGPRGFPRPEPGQPGFR
jgi:actin-like ATPase involved in cell morphogenesis